MGSVTESIHVDGVWRVAAAGGTRDVLDPADATTLAVVAEAGQVDADAAIEAARRAFDAGLWPRTPVAERAAVLRRVADFLQRDRAGSAGPRCRCSS